MMPYIPRVKKFAPIEGEVGTHSPAFERLLKHHEAETKDLLREVDLRGALLDLFVPDAKVPQADTLKQDIRARFFAMARDFMATRPSPMVARLVMAILTIMETSLLDEECSLVDQLYIVDGLVRSQGTK